MAGNVAAKILGAFDALGGIAELAGKEMAQTQLLVAQTNTARRLSLYQDLLFNNLPVEDVLTRIRSNPADQEFADFVEGLGELHSVEKWEENWAAVEDFIYTSETKNMNGYALPVFQETLSGIDVKMRGNLAALGFKRQADNWMVQVGQAQAALKSGATVTPAPAAPGARPINTAPQPASGFAEPERKPWKSPTAPGGLYTPPASNTSIAGTTDRKLVPDVNGYVGEQRNLRGVQAEPDQRSAEFFFNQTFVQARRNGDPSYTPVGRELKISWDPKTSAEITRLTVPVPNMNAPMTLTDPQGFPRGMGVNDEISGRPPAAIPAPRVRKINGDYEEVPFMGLPNPEKMYVENPADTSGGRLTSTPKPSPAPVPASVPASVEASTARPLTGVDPKKFTDEEKMAFLRYLKRNNPIAQKDNWIIEDKMKIWDGRWAGNPNDAKAFLKEYDAALAAGKPKNVVSVSGTSAPAQTTPQPSAVPSTPPVSTNVPAAAPIPSTSTPTQSPPDVFAAKLEGRVLNPELIMDTVTPLAQAYARSLVYGVEHGYITAQQAAGMIEAEKQNLVYESLGKIIEGVYGGALRSGMEPEDALTMAYHAATYFPSSVGGYSTAEMTNRYLEEAKKLNDTHIDRRNAKRKETSNAVDAMLSQTWESMVLAPNYEAAKQAFDDGLASIDRAHAAGGDMVELNRIQEWHERFINEWNEINSSSGTTPRYLDNQPGKDWLVGFYRDCDSGLNSRNTMLRVLEAAYTGNVGFSSSEYESLKGVLEKAATKFMPDDLFDNAFKEAGMVVDAKGKWAKEQREIIQIFREQQVNAPVPMAEQGALLSEIIKKYNMKEFNKNLLKPIGPSVGRTEDIEINGVVAQALAGTTYYVPPALKDEYVSTLQRQIPSLVKVAFGEGPESGRQVMISVTADNRPQISTVITAESLPWQVREKRGNLPYEARLIPYFDNDLEEWAFAYYVDGIREPFPVSPAVYMDGSRNSATDAEARAGAAAAYNRLAAESGYRLRGIDPNAIVPAKPFVLQSYSAWLRGKASLVRESYVRNSLGESWQAPK